MSRIIYTLLLTSTALLSTSTAFAQDDHSPLKRIVHKEGGFEALMPADTKLTTELVGTFNGTTTKRYEHEAEGGHNGAHFAVVITELSPTEISDVEKARTLNHLVDFDRKKLAKNFAIDIAKVTKKDIQRHGMKGVHLSLRSEDKAPATVWDLNKYMLFDGKQMFSAVHVAKANSDSLNLGIKFLDSVKGLSTAR